MASTIPDIDASRLGCVSDEIAAHKATAGDKIALLANTVVSVADAATTDIEAIQEDVATLQAAGGGGPYYPESLYLASYVESGTEVLAATATTTSIASHNITLTGTHSRTLIVTFSSSVGSYVGPYTVTGTIGGAAQTETISVPANGGVARQTVKTYDPGVDAIVLSRPAQGDTSGSYTVTVGDGFGLAVEAFEGPAGLDYGGHLLSITAAGATSAAIATSGIVGPTLAPPNGKLQLEAGALAGFGGDPLAVCYMAVVR